MFVCEGWREETWRLPFLISLKRVRNTLTVSWVCSVFSPKKMVIKILAFLFPVCEFVCTQLSAAPCLLPLLLALSWPLIWVPFPATLLFLRGLHFPCWHLSPKSLVCSGLMTSLLCSYFSLSCTLVDRCSLTAQLLFASFIFCLCTAEPRTVVLHRAGPGCRQLTLEPWFGCWLWGENQDSTEQLQSQASPGMAPARALAVQASLNPACKFNSDLEHTT